MTATELIERLEAAGGVLRLQGERVLYELPVGAASMVEVLRRRRTEVIRVLQERQQLVPPRATYSSHEGGSELCGKSCPDGYAVAVEKTTQSAPPPMPKGVRLLQWAPQLPPVAIERWAVVNDVPLFIHTTLCQLQAAMAGKNWLAGNWSIRELIDRLEQVGVRVSVEEVV
jgi:hypothetical protein